MVGSDRMSHISLKRIINSFWTKLFYKQNLPQTKLKQNSRWQNNPILLIYLQQKQFPVIDKYDDEHKLILYKR